MADMHARAFLFSLLLSTLCFVNMAWAHGIGLSIESTTPEGYVAYLDADVPVPFQNQAVRLDFEISSTKDEPLDFTDLWVRIEKDGMTVFAGPVTKAEFGTTGFTTTLPFAGNYDVHVRFQNKDKVISETMFNLPVEAEEVLGGNSKAPLILAGGSGIALGLLGGRLLLRTRTRAADRLS